MRLNLHLTRIFFTVATSGSFSRGAELLHISQSAASKAVRELEGQLGLALIERGGARAKSGLRLTEAGRALYEHARGIFALERAALDDLGARTGIKKGALTVGASTTVAGYWLPTHLAMYANRFPDIELQMVVGNTAAISQGLLDCEVDIAVVEGGVTDPGVSSLHWREESLVLVTGPETPLAGVDAVDSVTLSAARWLVREPGSGTREVTERLMQAEGVQWNHLIEVGSNEGIARSVSQGLGVAMLPAVVVQDLLALGRLATMNIGGAKSFRRPLYLLKRAQRPLSPAARAFSSMLQEHETPL
ncbi:MAG TPA: LysR family transcriptional regulator [Pusillimonas sp.]|uniref:LysR family transcriptional regulator n=1 Tax=unclassified Pusillimonas TaxID=2640016 RepID=UPI002632C1B4|nr:MULTISPECIES: LysR family transcriptional regulator [unclassified Pusillimonas]HLU19721.1 LysR family transcriptional regulator [Pusillimonas sp.]